MVKKTRTSLKKRAKQNRTKITQMVNMKLLVQLGMKSKRMKSKRMRRLHLRRSAKQRNERSNPQLGSRSTERTSSYAASEQCKKMACYSSAPILSQF